MDVIQKPRRANTIDSWAITILTVGLLVMLPTPSWGQWPIKEFEVVGLQPAGRPLGDNPNRDLVRGVYVRAMRSLGLDPDLIETVELSDSIRAQIQEHLHTSAELLETWGFPPPALEPVVTRSDGVDAYRVYVLEGIPTAGRYEQNSCYNGVSENIVLLDAGSVISGPRVTAKGLSTAGHELFHAVQHATPFFRGPDCGSGIGHWITEGQAEAIGWALVRAAGAIDLGGTEIEPLMARNYSRALPVPLRGMQGLAQEDPAYGTGSFWHYLAEMTFSSVTGGGRPGPEPHGFDYRYLARMLATEPVAHDCATAGAGCGAEVQWVDEAVRRLFRRSLRETFPLFLDAFVEYGEHRLGELRPFSGGIQSNREFWWPFVIDCWPVDLVAAGGAVTVPPSGDPPGPIQREPAGEVRYTVDLPRLSGLCFNVKLHGFSGPPTVAATVEAIESEEKTIQDLMSSVSGRPIEADEARVLDGGPGDPSTATWVFEADENESTIFLLSHVARNAQGTENLKGLPVTFTLLQTYAEFTSISTSSGPSAEEIARPVEIDFGQGLEAVATPAPSGYDADPGLAEPCWFRVPGMTNARGDLLSFWIDHEGAISPGDYPVANGLDVQAVDGGWTLRADRLPPGMVVVAFDLGADNPMSGGARQSFLGTAGTLTIESLNEGARFATGVIDVSGVNRLMGRIEAGDKPPPIYLPQASIRVKFGIRLHDPGDPVDHKGVAECVTAVR